MVSRTKSILEDQYDHEVHMRNGEVEGFDEKKLDSIRWWEEWTGAASCADLNVCFTGDGKYGTSSSKSTRKEQEFLSNQGLREIHIKYKGRTAKDLAAYIDAQL